MNNKCTGTEALPQAEDKPATSITDIPSELLSIILAMSDDVETQRKSLEVNHKFRKSAVDNNYGGGQAALFNIINNIFKKEAKLIKKRAQENHENITADINDYIRLVIFINQVRYYFSANDKINIINNLQLSDPSTSVQTKLNTLTLPNPAQQNPVVTVQTYRQSRLAHFEAIKQKTFLFNASESYLVIEKKLNGWRNRFNASIPDTKENQRIKNKFNNHILANRLLRSDNHAFVRSADGTNSFGINDSTECLAWRKFANKVEDPYLVRLFNFKKTDSEIFNTFSPTLSFYNSTLGLFETHNEKITDNINNAKNIKKALLVVFNTATILVCLIPIIILICIQLLIAAVEIIIRRAETAIRKNNSFNVEPIKEPSVAMDNYPNETPYIMPKVI